jgi:hypothetical protein
MLKFYLDRVLNRFLPGVKGVALLIILPASFIVIFYFFSNLIKTFTAEENDKVIEYEKKFAPLKEDLPRNAFVNYVTDKTEDYDFSIAAYVLVPVRIIRGLKPQQDYLIAHYEKKTKTPKFEGYTLKRKYGNGIMLFGRNK